MNIEVWQSLNSELSKHNAQLVAVSKTKPVEAIRELYNAGQRIFGENKVQEMEEKYLLLPTDIQWHLIGHLQTNKVKYIAPFVTMIHSVDSLKLLQEIDKQAAKHNRVIPCLLQVYIAKEESKYGLDEPELEALLNSPDLPNLKNIELCGLMGMATNTDDEALIHNEFNYLHTLHSTIKNKYFSKQPSFKELSMGMSSDYKIALECGSTLIRIGSALFGERNYNQ